MAAKTLREALEKANIETEIKKILCIGPSCELVSRIEDGEEVIHQRLENELKDFFAHEIMKFMGRAPTEDEIRIDPEYAKEWDQEQLTMIKFLNRIFNNGK